MPKYRYRIKSTGLSSARFGPCEVCKKHCSEVFHQVEQKEFVSVEKPGEISLTHYECWDYFGHEQCLIGKQR